MHGNGSGEVGRTMRSAVSMSAVLLLAACSSGSSDSVPASSTPRHGSGMLAVWDTCGSGGPTTLVDPMNGVARQCGVDRTSVPVPRERRRRSNPPAGLLQQRGCLVPRQQVGRVRQQPDRSSRPRHRCHRPTRPTGLGVIAPDTRLGLTGLRPTRSVAPGRGGLSGERRTQVGEVRGGPLGRQQSDPCTRR